MKLIMSKDTHIIKIHWNVRLFTHEAHLIRKGNKINATFVKKQIVVTRDKYTKSNISKEN